MWIDHAGGVQCGFLEGPFKPALLVIDFQEDFCPPNGALAVPHGRDIAPVVNDLLSLPFAIKVATRDWHPLDHVSFAANHPSAAPFTSTHTIYAPADSPCLERHQDPDMAAPASSPAMRTTTTIKTTKTAKTAKTTPPHDTTRLWPVHCVADTPGAQLAREMDTSAVDLVVDKGKDPRVEMYSAFRDPFGVSESGLEARLRAERVTDVYVCGLAFDYCVRRTAEDAARAGWRVWVVREGVRAIDEAGWDGVERELGEMGVRVVEEGGREVGLVRALSG